MEESYTEVLVNTVGGGEFTLSNSFLLHLFNRYKDDPELFDEYINIGSNFKYERTMAYDSKYDFLQRYDLTTGKPHGHWFGRKNVDTHFELRPELNIYTNSKIISHAKIFSSKGISDIKYMDIRVWHVPTKYLDVFFRTFIKREGCIVNAYNVLEETRKILNGSMKKEDANIITQEYLSSDLPIDAFEIVFIDKIYKSIKK
jgi:hypothetical protein